MAKHKCPQCGNRFDYKQYGWLCPECGFIILGSTEAKAFKQEQIDDQHKKESSKLKRAASEVKSYSKRRLFSMCVGCIFMLVLIFGIGLSAKIPELIRRQASAEKESEIVCTTAEMGEVLSIAPYTVQITQAFVPKWDELPKSDDLKYLAVSFVTAGKNRETFFDNLSDSAWICLHDTEADAYLEAQSPYKLTGSNENQSTLRFMNVTDGLDQKEGCLIFLVNAYDREYELCIFAGNRSEKFGKYDIEVNEQYTIPLEITEQKAVNGS